MNSWVLIIAFFSPGGDFMGKQEIQQRDRATCELSRQTIAQDAPLSRVRTLCVERDRRGVNVDRNISLD